MSLIKLEQNNILIQGQNREELSFPKNISLALAAFVLSTNLALAEPNKTIGTVSFMEGGTAELYVDKNGDYQIRNGNSKNGSDFIYGTTIIEGKKYIVTSPGIGNEIEVFLEKDGELYREYYKKYGSKKAYKLIKARENYLKNFLNDNPISKFSSETERLDKAIEGWELVLKELNKM
ncbi:MAG: hypothetical protein PHV23_05965 [Candidatus Gracilibacteria bacterium]|nr:hypothetical protein [Candidatus Gracilibacteria bacterium]